MTHGTASNYARGCRCDECVTAKRAYDRDSYVRRGWVSRVDRKLLGEALREMFPLGLTDDCPARMLQRRP